MELLDVYDSLGNKTGRVVERGKPNEEFADNEHIAVAIIYIENDNGEFLIQKTSKEKGGEYSSTGGHIDSGETPLSSIRREVEEELGINVDNDKIEEYGFLSFDMPLRFLFYLKKNIEINEIKVQQEEVDYVKYMTVDEIYKLIDDNLMLKSHGIMFKELMNRLSR